MRKEFAVTGQERNFDILFVSNRSHFYQEFKGDGRRTHKTSMRKEFAVTHLGRISYFLVMEVVQNRSLSC